MCFLKYYSRFLSAHVIPSRNVPQLISFLINNRKEGTTFKNIKVFSFSLFFFCSNPAYNSSPEQRQEKRDIPVHDIQDHIGSLMIPVRAVLCTCPLKVVQPLRVKLHLPLPQKTRKINNKPTVISLHKPCYMYLLLYDTYAK